MVVGKTKEIWVAGRVYRADYFSGCGHKLFDYGSIFKKHSLSDTTAFSGSVLFFSEAKNSGLEGAPFYKQAGIGLHE